MYDIDLITDDDYDFLGFDERDERDAAKADFLREVLTGLPARPGTRR